MISLSGNKILMLPEINVLSNRFSWQQGNEQQTINVKYLTGQCATAGAFTLLVSTN